MGSLSSLRPDTDNFGFEQATSAVAVPLEFTGAVAIAVTGRRLTALVNVPRGDRSYAIVTDVFKEIIWGLIQGLTEFLPISSSGHLILVPTWLGLDTPDLGTSAFLHLGTLIAVLWFYRADFAMLLRFRHNTEACHIIKLLAIGTIPAAIGVLGKDLIGDIQESATLVSVALIATGAVLWLSGFLRQGTNAVEEASPTDALLIGLAQLVALVPGISRSGMTITAGFSRSLDRVEAARFSFLLGVPAIAGAALQQSLTGASFRSATVVGMVVAGVSGYLSIAFFIKILTKVGLRPFAYYAMAAGITSLVVL